MVPDSLATFSLKERLLLYLMIVQEAEREEAQELLGCSAWFVRRTLEKCRQEFAKEIAYADQT
jgi:hypothetical protein